MYDFNSALPQGSFAVDWIDQDELSDALADTAPDWIPQLFPRGRRDTDGNWRLANIRGEPPRKSGSCVICMSGDHAGSWHDYDGGAGGGPLSTIKEVTGHSGAELFAYARELVGNRQRRQRPKRTPRDFTAEINHVLRLSKKPIGDTLAGTYFRARGINPPPEGDLSFNDNTTHWQTGMGRPALIGQFVYPNGAMPTEPGIHRTYLKDDGTWHDGQGAKKMLGASIGGVVIRMGALDKPPEFVGVGEGIESTAAGMQIFNVPVGWATASAGGMDRLAEWLLANRNGCPVKRMAIFIDHGKVGVRVGDALMAACKELGIEAGIAHPKGGDDLADDIHKGCTGHANPFQLIGTAAISYPSLDQVNVAINNMPRFDAAALTQTMRLISDRCVGLEQEGESYEAYVGVLFTAIKRDKGFPLDTLKLEFKTALARARRLNREALDQLEEIPDWRAKAMRNQDQTFKPILHNVALALKHELDWRQSDGTHIVAMNEFTGFISLRGIAPWERKRSAAMLGKLKSWRNWTDDDDLQTTFWVQGPGRDISAGRDVCFMGVQMIAGENSFHPVRDFLESLPPWDRVPRLRGLLPIYAGCDATPINEIFGAKWCIGAVARVMKPGCQMDTALILEGLQGIGKSTFFRILAGEEFFTDQISEFGTKDAALEMRGKWVIELAELDAMGKAETSRIKRFIGQTHDRCRPPYARAVQEQPRQNVFCGTTNENEYLRDPTGARRFWPATANKLDLQKLRNDRDQLWAEALWRFNAGESWWLDNDGDNALASTEQSLRYQSDSWEFVISNYLRNNLTGHHVTIPQILEHALGITEKAKWDRTAQLRVGACLRRLGYALGGREGSGTRERFYILKSEQQKASDIHAAAITVPQQPSQNFMEHSDYEDRERNPGEDC